MTRISFDDRVLKTNDCWLWQGPVQSRGYGITRDEGRLITTHRLAWERAFGPIPKGLLVCHRCDTPRCVRPDHLFLGTNADNAADKSRKGRASNQFGSLIGRVELAEVIKDRASGMTFRALAKKHSIAVSAAFRIVAAEQTETVARTGC